MNDEDINYTESKLIIADKGNIIIDYQPQYNEEINKKVEELGWKNE